MIQDGMSTIDGQDTRRGIRVDTVITSTLVTAALEYFVIQNGSSAEPGTGIFTNGIVTLTHSLVSGNHGFYGGAIFNGGTLTLNNSTVSNNAIYPAPFYHSWGGGIYNVSDGTLVLNNSTISGNTAAEHGRIVIQSVKTALSEVGAKESPQRTYSCSKMGSLPILNWMHLRFRWSLHRLK